MESSRGALERSRGVAAAEERGRPRDCARSPGASVHSALAYLRNTYCTVLYCTVLYCTVCAPTVLCDVLRMRWGWSILVWLGVMVKSL